VPTPAGIVLSPDAGNDRGDIFPEIGARLLATGAARSGAVGQAKCHIIRAAQAVSFAINSLESALTVR